LVSRSASPAGPDVCGRGYTFLLGKLSHDINIILDFENGILLSNSIIIISRFPGPK